MLKRNMVQKTIDVLSYLSANPRGAVLTDIAKALNCPKTTVHDILKTLADNNFVQYNKSTHKKYSIGVNVYTIGVRYLESSNLFRIAKPYLILLADKYEKTTFLGKRMNDRVVSIYKFASLLAKAPSGNVGDLKRLHASAIGKCYLAFDPEAAQFVDTIDLPAITPYTITDRGRLKSHIEKLKALGYSWEQREAHIKMACLAAPIYEKGVMVATISMTGWYREDEDYASQGNEIAQLAKLISVQLDQEYTI